MADIKQKFGTKTNFTITLASLANQTARASTAVDNGTNLFLDALVQLVIKSNAAGVLSTGYINVYAYGSADDGTSYSDNATGTDAAITLTVPSNARLIGVINVVAVATTYESHPMSVASAFGGTMPEDWGIIVENQSGAALDATEGNHLYFYKGVLSQSA